MTLSNSAMYFDIEAFSSSVRDFLDNSRPQDAKGLLGFENQALSLGRRLADILLADIIKQTLGSEERNHEAVERKRADSELKLRGNGERPVEIRLPGGGHVSVFAQYMIVDRRGTPGKSRALGKRGPSGTGTYPLLEQLGIEGGATPYVRLECARTMVLSSSYQSALEHLERHGLSMDEKTMVRLGLGVGQQLLDHRDSELQSARDLPIPEDGELAGKRIIISTDGGRTKTRRSHTRGRRKKNGRRGFTTEWKEPKGLLIGVLDDKGRMSKESLTWLDMTMQDADGLFELMVGYLRLLGAAHAEEIVFVADGARWIWDRLPALIKAAELDPTRMLNLLDFYHACNHLSDALSLCKALSEKKRQRLYKGLRQQLKEGNHIAVIEALRLHAKGRRAKGINKEIAYFEKHGDHLAYDSAQKRKLPMGSGAMESTVRRVINLRFKGPSLMWKVSHLEKMLHVRALAMSGRLEEEFIAVHWKALSWPGTAESLSSAA